MKQQFYLQNLLMKWQLYFAKLADETAIVTRSVGLSRKSEILTFELITVSNNSDSKLYNDV